MLRLRPYKKCDAKRIVAWIKDKDTFNKWSAGKIKSYPLTAEELNGYYAGYDESDEFFVMSAFDEDGVTGQLVMRFLDEEKKFLKFGFVIVDSSKRGKGYGREMLRLAMEYARNILKVEKITIGVFENNIPAYKCYKSIGFAKNPEKETIYSIDGESWKCYELEYIPD